MEQNKCKVCGKDMKLIPAGVSRKSGKSYDAFYSCPDRCKQPFTTKVNNSSSEEVIRKLTDVAFDVGEIKLMLSDLHEAWKSKQK